MLIKKRKIYIFFFCFNSFNGYLCVLMDICVGGCWGGTSEIRQTWGGGACPKRLKTPVLLDILTVINTSGGQSTQIKYLSKSTDTYSKILLQ